MARGALPECHNLRCRGTQPVNKDECVYWHGAAHKIKTDFGACYFDSSNWLPIRRQPTGPLVRFFPYIHPGYGWYSNWIPTTYQPTPFTPLDQPADIVSASALSYQRRFSAVTRSNWCDPSSKVFRRRMDRNLQDGLLGGPQAIYALFWLV